MRKPIIFILALILAYVCWGQCSFPSIGTNAVGVPNVDTAIIDGITPQCTQCPSEGCVAWSLPRDFNGHFFLNSPSNALMSVQIVDTCHLLLFDTCGILPPAGVAGQALQIAYSVIGDNEVIVCGALGDSVIILVKTVPSPQEELGPPYLDLSTCNPPVGIQEPIPSCIDKHYYDIVHCRHVCGSNRNDLEGGLYWEWCGTMENGRKVLIFDR